MLTCIFESVHEAKTSIEADQPDPKVTANSPRLMISSSFLRNGGVNLRIGAEGAPIGIPFEAGSQSEMSGSQRTIVGFEDADDFVFVLRMRETIGRKSGQVRQKQFKDRHLFGVDKDLQKKHTDCKDEFHIVGLTGDVFDLEGIEAGKVENGEVTVCMKLEKNKSMETKSTICWIQEDVRGVPCTRSVHGTTTRTFAHPHSPCNHSHLTPSRAPPRTPPKLTRVLTTNPSLTHDHLCLTIHPPYISPPAPSITPLFLLPPARSAPSPQK